MKRQLIILIVIILICGGIIFALLAISKTPAPSVEDSGSLPFVWTIEDVPRTPAPNGEPFTIKTLEADLQVKNFFPQSQPIRGYDGVILKKTPGYEIRYFTKEQSLLISVLQTPVLEVKQQAEKELPSLLGLSEEDICKLKIEVTTIISVDEELAGQELGVGFCQ